MLTYTCIITYTDVCHKIVWFLNFKFKILQMITHPQNSDELDEVISFFNLQCTICKRNPSISINNSSLSSIDPNL